MAKRFGPKNPKNVKKLEKAYFKLIDALLTCRNGQEIKILMANQHLIDADLVKIMGAVAGMLAEEGDRDLAEFLINLAVNLKMRLESPSHAERRPANSRKASDTANSKEFGSFFAEIGIAMRMRNGNPDAAHSILQARLAQDRDFIERVYSWVTAQIAEADPKKAAAFATILALFGGVILEYPLGDRAQNIEAAISCFKTAVKFTNRDIYPGLWAEVQDHLGIAYDKRILGDRAENLEQAIDAFEQGLQVLNRELSPEQWGVTHHNLGMAYRERIWGEKAENIERSIAAHKAALQVRTRETTPERWAMTQRELALDYRHRIEGDKAENQEMAIAACQASLEVYTRAAFPLEWAKNQNNLGNVYRERIRGERSENLQKATQAYKNALPVFTREAFPEKWAMLQLNLGNVYRERGLIDEALACYRAALEIFTPAAFPEKGFQIGQEMGHLGFEAGLWSVAIEGYTAAIAALAQKMAMADTEVRRQEIRAEAIAIYEFMVQACINNGQPEKAKEYAERSGSVRLVNNLDNPDIDTLREYQDFLDRLHQTIHKSEGNPEVVYPFLQANLDKLDEFFPQVLRAIVSD